MRLDHVIVAVADLDAATVRFEALLGVPASIRSDHPRGTRNALFLFPAGPYLELLSLWDAPERGTSAQGLASRLAERGDGVEAIALATDDIDAEVESMRARGLDLPDAVPNSGVSAGGLVRTWRGARLPGPDGDDAFLIQHMNDGWRTELVGAAVAGRETTAVTGIHHVAFDVPDADVSSAGWAERYDLARTRQIVSERMGAKVNIHQAGAATIEFVSATTADGPVARRIARRGPGLSSLAFEVEDIAAATQAVRAMGITVGDPEPGVLPGGIVARIDPATLHGVSAQLLMFEPPRPSG